jgi:signal transduction histidine kinase
MAPRLLRRLYALAVGSVVLAVVVSMLAARFSPPPPSPGIIRSALLHLGDVVDDPMGRADEMRLLRDEADLDVGLYDENGALLAQNVDPPPKFAWPPPIGSPEPDHPPPDFDRPPPGFDPHGPPHHDHDEGWRGPPPLMHELLGGHREHHGPPNHGPPDHGFGPGPPSALSMWIESPTGHRYIAVVDGPGLKDTTKLTLLALGVLALLALMSVPFAVTLARPLGELARVTKAFGDGDMNARADAKKAGAFADLATAFNDMAARVTSSMKSERELLANVSHELRTPLARIRVALDLASEDAALAKESLTDIEGDLGELEGLVDDILTAARLESASAPLAKKVRTAAATVLAESARRFRTRHAKHTLDVEVDSARDIEIECDPILLRRAIDNFLDNAGKYSDASSTVALRAKIVGRNVVVDVADRGVGIAREDQTKLFTPFFRADKSRAKKSGGVGLGLALSKRIVEAHGGSVSIASELGHGTTVTIALPIVHDRNHVDERRDQAS